MNTNQFQKMWKILAAAYAMVLVSCGENHSPGESSSGVTPGSIHPCSHVCPECGDCLDASCTFDSCLEKCRCINYAHLDALLCANGDTDYRIVLPENPAEFLFNAASEMNYFMDMASAVEFDVVMENDVQTADKIISIGQTKFATEANIDPTGLNTSGFVVKTVGNSIYINGVTPRATLFGVYDFLAKTVRYDCFGAGEVYVTKAKTLYVPDFDYSKEPDIEFRSPGLDYLSSYNGNLSERMGFNGIKWLYPNGGAAFHNSFHYLPKATYQESHPLWYGGEQICYTAHGDEKEYAEMLRVITDVMKRSLLEMPEGQIFTFTQQDADGFCSCDACQTIRNKYDTYSAVIIQFMNDVIDIMEPYIADNYPGRNVRYAFFAYTQSTLPAPVKLDENGKYVPMDEDVVPNPKTCVIYAPITSDFIHSKYDPQNAGVYETMAKWHSLMGDNMLYWFYSAYFWDYFVPYDNFESMQGNYQACHEQGAAWMYDQAQYNTNDATGFVHLKAYLQSKLLWDVNANVPALTHAFFKNYYKGAATAMMKFYSAMRLQYSFMSEYLDVGGWWGNQIDNPLYFPVGILREWISYCEEAYEAIASLRDSDPETYEKLYDRICLESLAPRYLMIGLYAAEYTASELYEVKVQFKEDCSRLGITRKSEKEAITALWANWGI